METRVNSTYHCLIPKCKNVTSLKNFRPIGLCNTQNKIITKIIANRMKPLLSYIICHSQASFLSKRRTSDNAIIVQAYIRHLSEMKGEQANMILKIDLKNAFDRLEWNGLL